MRKIVKEFANFAVRSDRKEDKTFFEVLVSFLYRGWKLGRDFIYSSNSNAISVAYLESRHLYRKVAKDSYKYVTFQDLMTATSKLEKIVPNDFDLIIGTPRSGLLVANILALKFGRPLSSVDSPEKHWKSKHMEDSGFYGKILLVDDSITSGTTMEGALNRVRRSFPDADISTAVLFATEETKTLTDFYIECIEPPRIFEWNLLHSKKGRVAVDFDGFLCEEIESGLSKDDERYGAFIRNAHPYLIPAFEVDAIISNRKEEYRALTTEWLKHHKVKYNHLILRGYENTDKVAHKVYALKKIKPELFFESKLDEAEEIWKRTHIPVYCVETNEIFS